MYAVLRLLVMLAAVPAAAETVYKSVDAHGHVTYSTEPPAQAVTTQPLTLPPPPDTAEVENIQRQQQALQQIETQLEQEQQARQMRRAEKMRHAEQTLQHARIRLERAQTREETDWQPRAKGGRHLKEDYWQRVQAAEDELREAEQALLQAQRN